MARKIGAPVYALPEDISEVRERGGGGGKERQYFIFLFCSGETQDGDDSVCQLDVGRHELNSN